MNPFYRRLITFGQLIQQLSHRNQTNYREVIEVEHPGYVAFSKPAKIKPRLSFKKPIPKEDRHQIMELFNKCFNARELAH